MQEALESSNEECENCSDDDYLSRYHDFIEEKENQEAQIKETADIIFSLLYSPKEALEKTFR